MVYYCVICIACNRYGFSQFFQPGAALNLVLPTAQELSSASLPATTGFTLQSFLSHVFPRSIAEAMANNDILQVLVFAIFFGSALAYVNQGKEKDSVIIRLTDELSKIMFRITDYVMKFAPIAVLQRLLLQLQYKV